MEPELKPTKLPGQFLPVMRLVLTQRGQGSERDERIGRLVLSHLEPTQRDFLLSCPDHQTEQSILALGYRNVRAYCAQLDLCHHALRAVAWKLGLIDNPGRRWRAVRLPMVVALLERHLGADPAQSEFACVACGHLVHVPVGEKKKLTCPNCKVIFGLRFNDGRRIDFSRPRTPRDPWVRMDSYSKLDPYEILEVSHTASFDEMRQAYRRQLMRCHPDRVHSLGSPTAWWAAEEAARNVNAAWALIEQRARR